LNAGFSRVFRKNLRFFFKNLPASFFFKSRFLRTLFLALSQFNAAPISTNISIYVMRVLHPFETFWAIEIKKAARSFALLVKLSVARCDLSQVELALCVLVMTRNAP